MRGLRYLFVVGLLGACSEQPAGETVTYNMGWLPQGSQAGVVAALELDIYADAGLKVEIVRGFGGIRTVNEIDQGMFEFGYGDPLSVLLNRVQGGDTRMVAAINSRWPAGLCFVADRHRIEMPADLKGLTIGGGQNSPVQVILPLWLEQNGVAPDSYNLLQMDPAVVDVALVEGTIDAAECWLGSNKAFIEHRGSEAGVTIGWIEYAAFGLDMYGSGLVTSDQMIASDGDVVAAFVESTLRGYDWVRDNPSAAADMMVRRFPVLNRDIVAQQIRETIDLTHGNTAAGALDAERMRRAMEFLHNAYELDGPVSPSDVYNTEYLPMSVEQEN